MTVCIIPLLCIQQRPLACSRPAGYLQAGDLSMLGHMVIPNYRLCGRRREVQLWHAHEAELSINIYGARMCPAAERLQEHPLWEMQQ